MPIQSSVAITIGPQGAGKTLSRAARFLSEDFLPFRDGDLWSNYPLNVEAISQAAAKRRPSRDGVKQSAEQIAERIHRIPEDWLADMRAGRATVEDFIKDEGPSKFAGAHIAIDEAQYFVGPNQPVENMEAWKGFLSEIRHYKCTIEFISQEDSLLHDDVVALAGVRHRVWPDDVRHDPIFGIAYGDWWELRAKATGRYSGRSFEQPEFKMGRAWEKNGPAIPFTRSDRLFAFYDSFSPPAGVDADEHDTSPPKLEWQRRSWPELLRWFVVRNLFALMTRGGLLLFMFWFTLGGGWVHALGFIQGVVVRSVTQQVTTGSEDPSEVATGAAVESSGSSGSREALQPPAAGEVETAELRARVAELEGLVAELAERMETGGELVAVQVGQAVLADGQTLAAGDTVERGKHVGETVEAVDFERGALRFESGRLVRLPPVGASVSGGGGSSGVSAVVPGGSATGSGAGAAGRGGRAGDDQGTADAPAAIRRSAGRTDSRDNRGRQGSRVGAGYGRYPRSPATSNAGGPGSAVGRRSPSGRAVVVPRPSAAGGQDNASASGSSLGVY